MDMDCAETASSLINQLHGGRRSSASARKAKETDTQRRRRRRKLQKTRRNQNCVTKTEGTDEGKKGSGLAPESGGLPLNSRRVKSYSVHVGNLPTDVSKHDLTELFKGVGPVHEVYIAPTPAANAKVTYGFVRYLEPKHCAQAIKDLNRWCIHDEQLRVELARETIQDRSAGPMTRRDHHQRQKLNLKKNDDDEMIMRKVKQICSEFSQKHAECMRKFVMNDQNDNSRPISPMSDINLPLFMKEVQKADSNLTPPIRFELPRVTLDLDEFDEAFGLSPPSTPDPLLSGSSKNKLQTEQFPEPVRMSPSARLPKTVGLTNSAMHSEVPFQPRASVDSDRFQHQPSVNNGACQTSILSGAGAFVKVPQHSSLVRENAYVPPQQARGNPLVQSPPLDLQQPFVISQTIGGEQAVNEESFDVSPVSLSARYQPLRSQHPGFDNYAPGVYELDEQGTDVYNVFAEKSPTGLKCTLTPKGTRIVTNSSSPELDAHSGLQCTLTPGGTRTVMKANKSELTTGRQIVHDLSFETACSRLPESIQELNLLSSESNNRTNQSAAIPTCSSVLSLSDSNKSDASSTLSSDFESPTPSVLTDPFQCEQSLLMSSYFERAQLCHDPHKQVSRSTPPSTLSPDLDTDQLLENACSQDSSSSQSDSNTRPFFESSNGLNNQNITLSNSSPRVKDSSPRFSNHGVLSTSISPQTNRDAPQPMGRGRGILAFQNMFRPVGGSPPNLEESQS